MAIMDDYYTVKELAKVYGVTRQAAEKTIKKYNIPFETIGKQKFIKRDALGSVYCSGCKIKLNPEFKYCPQCGVGKLYPPPSDAANSEKLQ